MSYSFAMLTQLVDDEIRNHGPGGVPVPTVAIVDNGDGTLSSL